jgi:hypothetical protein
MEVVEREMIDAIVNALGMIRQSYSLDEFNLDKCAAALSLLLEGGRSEKETLAEDDDALSSMFLIHN